MCPERGCEGVSSVGSIRVREEGERAEQLLDCLRAKAAAYNVGIETGSSGTLMVNDVAGWTDDLPGFLRAQLDACSTDLDYEWTPYIFVQQAD
jgi:hypothetical protein